MSKKKRILFNTEASYTFSGFGTYAYEIIKRLVATNKYEIAEFASYGFVNDPRDINIKWKIYPNAVRENDPRINLYRSKPTYQFGEWRFDRVCLDFKPECIISTRDPWMLEWEKDSTFRRFFHLVWMPTCDSAPQQEGWIDSFIQADGVLTWSDFGYDRLKKESGGKIKLFKSAPAGTNLDIFKPSIDKREHRIKMGVLPDINIIGTVMRNQRRKLYPDLFYTFKLFLEKCRDKGLDKLADNTYLYLHTSYPDAGWNLANLIREYSISHRVICSYICRQCNKWFASPFVDALTVCPHCGGQAILPNVSCGVQHSFLAEIYKLFDVYVQYAICLGSNEEILTSTGWKPISQIKIGEEVWTHKHRWRKVLNVWKNLSKNKDKYQIKICGDYESINIITENHPVYSITKKQFNSNDKIRSLREILGTKLYNNTLKSLNPIFNPVRQLRNGDMIVYTIDDSIKDIDNIDISNFVKYNNNYSHTIKIDEEFCRFIGLFVADGNSNLQNGQIKITSNIKEIKNILLSTNVLQKLGNKNITIRKYPNRNAIDIILNSTLHRDIFFHWCKNKTNKQLPNWSLYLSINKQKAILQGLFMGDGYFSIKRNISIYNTISKILADQLKFILRRLRINYNVHIVDKNKYNHYDNYNRQPQYKFEIYGNIANGEFITDRHNTQNLYIDNLHLLQISSIKKVEYNNDVYNIETEEDNSYSTKIGIVHNCEGCGMPQIEAASCGVPIMAINYSAMSDVVKRTGGISLPQIQNFPLSTFLELETGAYRALPDNHKCSDIFIEFFQKSEEERKQMGKVARKSCEEYYNWDNIAHIWEEYLDKVELTGLQGKWDAPPMLWNVPNKIPDNLSNEQFTSWLFNEVVRKPHLRYGYQGTKLCTELNMGASLTNGIHPIDRNTIFQYYYNSALNTINSEKIRCGILSTNYEDYIEYAHMKEKMVNIKEDDIIE